LKVLAVSISVFNYFVAVVEECSSAKYQYPYIWEIIGNSYWGSKKPQILKEITQLNLH